MTVKAVFTIFIAFLVLCINSRCKKPGIKSVPLMCQTMSQDAQNLLHVWAAQFLWVYRAILCFADINHTIRGILIKRYHCKSWSFRRCFSAKITCKLLVQIVAASVVVMHGLRVHYISNPNIFSSTHIFHLEFGPRRLQFLWIVGVTNAVN